MLPVVVGESGIGKTNLVRAVARKLAERNCGLRLVSVDVAAVFAGQLFPADREAAVTALLDEAHSTPGTVLVLEHMDLIGGETNLGALLLSRSMDAGLRMIGTSLPGGLPHLTVNPLRRRLHIVRLREPTPAESLEILRALTPRLSEHHGLDIDESCLPFCVSASQELDGCFPARAIDLLDTACALAALEGAQVVGLDDICLAATGMRAVA